MVMLPCKCGGLPFTFQSGVLWCVKCRKCGSLVSEWDEWDVIEDWNERQRDESNSDRRR